MRSQCVWDYMTRREAAGRGDHVEVLRLYDAAGHPPPGNANQQGAIERMRGALKQKRGILPGCAYLYPPCSARWMA